MPFPIVNLRPTGDTDKYVFFADLHQGEAFVEGQNKPVVSIFGVSVENYTFGVKGPELKG